SEGGGRARRSRPHQLETLRNPRQFRVAAAPAWIERCVFGHDPAHRNGDRAGRRRRQPDDQGRHGHISSRRSRCGGADGAAGRRRRKSADWLKARRRRAGESSQRLFRRLPSDRRQARHHRLPHQGGRRAAQAHRRDCRPTRNPEKLKFGSWFMAKVHVTTTINGEPMEFLCEPSDTMLDALRGPLALTGSKEGCASGDCGACSITLDDRLICSCLMLAVESEGHEIRTIEGMANGEKLHPLQQKFLEMAALQCGICTSGMLVASDALLKKKPDPSEEEVRFWLAGN